MTELQNLTLSFGEKRIFTDFSYRFAENKITAIIGPSGVGKTTLLRLLTGLQKPDQGKVTADGSVSVLFQEPRLCPWMTAAMNIALVLDGKRSLPTAKKWLERVHLSSDADRYPSELSGGMEQRVALARTLAYATERDCRLLILDEPFKGLDADLHSEMIGLIRECAVGRTVLLVSHDETDVELLADCRLILGNPDNP